MPSEQFKVVMAGGDSFGKLFTQAFWNGHTLAQLEDAESKLVRKFESLPPGICEETGVRAWRAARATADSLLRLIRAAKDDWDERLENAAEVAERGGTYEEQEAAWEGAAEPEETPEEREGREAHEAEACPACGSHASGRCCDWTVGKGERFEDDG